MSDELLKKWQYTKLRNGTYRIYHQDDPNLVLNTKSKDEAITRVKAIQKTLRYDDDGNYLGQVKPKVKEPTKKDSYEKKADSIARFRAGKATTEDSLRVGYNPEELLDPTKSTLLVKLFKDKKVLESAKEDMASFDSETVDSMAVKNIDTAIKGLDEKITAITGNTEPNLDEDNLNATINVDVNKQSGLDKLFDILGFGGEQTDKKIKINTRTNELQRQEGLTYQEARKVATQEYEKEKANTDPAGLINYKK